MKRIALLAACSLAGCAQPKPRVVTQVEIVRQTIPAELLRDPPMPGSPKINTAEAVATWIVRLKADDLNKTDQIAAIARLQPKGQP